MPTGIRVFGARGRKIGVASIFAVVGFAQLLLTPEKAAPIDSNSNLRNWLFSQVFGRAPQFVTRRDLVPYNRLIEISQLIAGFIRSACVKGVKVMDAVQIDRSPSRRFIHCPVFPSYDLRKDGCHHGISLGRREP